MSESKESKKSPISDDDIRELFIEFQDPPEEILELANRTEFGGLASLTIPFMIALNPLSVLRIQFAIFMTIGYMIGRAQATKELTEAVIKE